MDLILPILCRTSFLKRTKWPPRDGDDVRQWIFWQQFLIKSELVDTGWIVDFSLYNNARYKASHHNFFLPSVYCTFNPLFIQLLYTSKSTIGLTKVVLIQMWASHPFTSNDCFNEFDLWSFHHHSLGDIRGITISLTRRFVTITLGSIYDKGSHTITVLNLFTHQQRLHILQTYLIPWFICRS